MPRSAPLILVSVLLLGIVEISAIAQDDDKIEGTLWTFRMTSHKSGSPVMCGLIRVDGKQHYQETRPDNTLYTSKRRWPRRELKEFDKVIGVTTVSKAKFARVRIDDLRAVTKDGEWHHGIKGDLDLHFTNVDEWHGYFRDSEGTHWQLDCRRFRN